MASAPFALEGDASTPPDVGSDPNITSLPVDPLGGYFTPPISPVDPSTLTNQLYYGPGIDPTSGAAITTYQGPGLNPYTGTSSVASGTVGTTSGSSILDQVLGTAKLALGIGAGVKSLSGTAPAQVKQGAPVSTAKVTAGTGGLLVWLIAGAFVAIVLWLEFGSGK